MNELEFIKQLETKGITLTPQQVNQFKQYFKILVEWNEKMNLTAITDEEGVYLKHFYDSLTIAFDFDFTDQSIVDVGAGAGFPSVPLKIVYPELKITIVDSLTKRITFLSSVELPTTAPSPIRALPRIKAQWRTSASLPTITGPFRNADEATFAVLWTHTLPSLFSYSSVSRLLPRAIIKSLIP